MERAPKRAYRRSMFRNDANQPELWRLEIDLTEEEIMADLLYPAEPPKAKDPDGTE